MQTLRSDLPKVIPVASRTQTKFSYFKSCTLPATTFLLKKKKKYSLHLPWHEKEPFLTRAPLDRYSEVRQEKAVDSILMDFSLGQEAEEAIMVAFSGSETCSQKFDPLHGYRYRRWSSLVVQQWHQAPALGEPHSHDYKEPINIQPFCTCTTILLLTFSIIINTWLETFNTSLQNRLCVRFCPSMS